MSLCPPNGQFPSHTLPQKLLPELLKLKYYLEMQYSPGVLCIPFHIKKKEEKFPKLRMMWEPGHWSESHTVMV